MRSTFGFFVLLILYQNVEGIDIFLETNVGRIRGVQANDGNYTMYLGIPYARINVSNPFGPALPQPNFEGVFNAVNDETQCPQYNFLLNQIAGSLDCLQIHIHVPASAHSGNLLPVFVSIHGGLFSFGNAGRQIHGSKYLVRHDVIFVSFNSRLGVYGFMCSQTPELPGNQGFKDQLIALRWIKRNIEAFGGDVNRITLYGGSSGAMSIDAHLYYTNENERLFSGVILGSGSALIPALGQEPDRNFPLNLAAILGYRGNNLAEALSFLARETPEVVVQASLSLGFATLFPCVEKEFEGVESFILEHPIKKDIPKATDVAILLGITSNECSMACGTASRPAHIDDIPEFFRLDYAFNFEDQEMEEMTSLMTQFYIGDEGPELNSDDQLNIGNFASDYLFIGPADRSVDKYIENGAERVFYYQFSYHGERNYNQVGSNVSFPGGLHGDDVGYIFDISPEALDVPNPPSPEDQLIIDRMTTMMTNFVKYKDPIPETSELLPIKWEPVVKGSPKYYLNIDTELSISSSPYHDRMAFWELFYNHNMNSHIANKPNIS